MYGETANRAPGEEEFQGLSPRVRGNHIDDLGYLRHERSIPACTGKPLIGLLGKRSFRVYPRVYGETTH